MRLFDEMLSAPMEEVKFDLRHFPIAWSDFILNPRRLRGSDFLMRWSQGSWSEERLIHAINATGKFVALPYGPSGAAPDKDVRQYELYFERLDKAGLGKMKRPDLLIFRKRDEAMVNETLAKIGGIRELPFTPEDVTEMKALLDIAVIAVECENSLWRAAQMPAYGTALSPQRRLGGKLGLKKSAVLPTIIIKEEDRIPLLKWQNEHRVPIHVWHVFFDMAFGLPLDTAESLVADGFILPTDQVFQAPNGATSKKILYKIYYHFAYPLARSSEEPQLCAAYIEDKNGHILPYVKFDGGTLALEPDVIPKLEEIACKRLEEN